MGLLISVLNGEAKWEVRPAGQSVIFYASAFKNLKCNFSNQLVASFMKLKTVLNLPQLQQND